MTEMRPALRLLSTLLTILCGTTIAAAAVQKGHAGAALEKAYVLDRTIYFSASFHAPGTTLPIRFGNDANQVSHAFRHIDGVVDQAKATTAITDDLTAAASSIKDGLNIRKVTVDGVELTYNAFRLPDGTINVGRITIPKP